MKGKNVAMSSDLKIISGLKRRSEKAFKKVYYQYKNLVYYHAFNILNNKEDAEDIMQNTFIKLMKNIDSIDDNSNLKQLLSKISKNEAIDLYRRKANHQHIYDENLVNNIKNNEIPSVPNDIKWTIEQQGEHYIFHPNGDLNSWLYCTNSNDGVRVGTNANNTFLTCTFNLCFCKRI